MPASSRATLILASHFKNIFNCCSQSLLSRPESVDSKSTISEKRMGVRRSKTESIDSIAIFCSSQALSGCFINSASLEPGSMSDWRLSCNSFCDGIPEVTLKQGIRYSLIIWEVVKREPKKMVATDATCFFCSWTVPPETIVADVPIHVTLFAALAFMRRISIATSAR